MVLSNNHPSLREPSNHWGRSFQSSSYPFRNLLSFDARDMCLVINAYPRAEMLTPNFTTAELRLIHQVCMPIHQRPHHKERACGAYQDTELGCTYTPWKQKLDSKAAGQGEGQSRGIRGSSSLFWVGRIAVLVSEVHILTRL